MSPRTLRIALVGCGQIADAHLQEIRKIEAAKVVAVCDRHLDLARQAAARFEVGGVFDDVEHMLATSKPDVVHVTTPPHSHLAIAAQALTAGAHVYLEKPFTVDVEEADQLLAAARAADRLVCVGHDQLYDPVWSECRDRVSDGQIGDLVHVDSVQGYNLAGPFGRTFTTESSHWIHRLPGGLFQNVMSHALYRITDLLPDENPLIQATWFGHAVGGGMPTELRATFRGETVSANLIFTCAARPVQRVARLYGTRGTLEVDLDGRTIRTFRELRMPGPFAKLEAPWRLLREGAAGIRNSTFNFLRGNIHYFAGMNRLFRLFYAAAIAGTTPPIVYSEIRRVTALMDNVFHACDGQQIKEAAPVSSAKKQLVPA